MQGRGDTSCFECHRDFFCFDGANSMGSCDLIFPSHSDCQEGERHGFPTHCNIDACCDIDNCSMNCPSICDGFVDCSVSTICSVSHCDDANCESPGLACFDEHCFSHTNVGELDLQSLLRLQGTTSLEAAALIAPGSDPGIAAKQSVNRPDQDVLGILDVHSADEIFAPFSIASLQCGQHSSQHFSCHALPKQFHGNLMESCFSLPTTEVTKSAETFQNLGICSNFSTCETYHSNENQHGCLHPLSHLIDTSCSIPFSCLHCRHEQPADSLNRSAGKIVKGSYSPHHRCRSRMHFHSRPYSPSSRSSRASVSLLASSPAETGSSLDGVSSSVLTTSELSSEEGKLHVCKWTTQVNEVKSTCNATFADARSLQNHLYIDHSSAVTGSKGVGYYCCWEGCSRLDEPFSQKSKLQGHFLTHSNHKNFKCSVCGKSFARQATLDRHERSHRGEKPYKCQECGKSFTDSSELKTHTRTHTGEKPFKCTFPGCTFETGDSSNMSSHRLTHGERKHKCQFPECNKSFTRPDQLKRHLKTTHKGKLPPAKSAPPSSATIDPLSSSTFSALC